jgi:cytochrome c-type biogenesis protein CcmH/NrfF
MPTNDLEKRLMKEILCTCTCARQDILSCECQTAADLRGQVLERLRATDASGKPKFDLSTESGRDAAYAAVAASFVQEYGGEQVLATPSGKTTWLFPLIAAIGGLGLLVYAGRRWIARGQSAPPPPAAAATKSAEDEKYADKLDDELDDADD